MLYNFSERRKMRAKIYNCKEIEKSQVKKKRKKKQEQVYFHDAFHWVKSIHKHACCSEQFTCHEIHNKR